MANLRSAERQSKREKRKSERKGERSETAGFHSKCAQIIGYIVRMSHLYVK